MTFPKEDTIKSHIDSLSNNDWGKLFTIIPAIESTNKFVESGGFELDDDDPDLINITPIQSAKVVYDFQKVMYELGLVIDFDWGGWDEGREIASNKNFKNLDTVTLLKLLTAFIRNNRFSDGALAERFEDGSILGILGELKNQILMK